MKGAYTRELVEQLLPTVWQQDAAWGLINPGAPDPDMPRAQADPKAAGTLYAHLADIRTAWHIAPLTLAQARALFCRYGLDLPLNATGLALGISRQAANFRIEAGVSCLVAVLNGDHVQTLEPVV